MRSQPYLINCNRLLQIWWSRQRHKLCKFHNVWSRSFRSASDWKSHVFTRLKFVHNTLHSANSPAGDQHEATMPGSKIVYFAFCSACSCFHVRRHGAWQQRTRSAMHFPQETHFAANSLRIKQTHAKVVNVHTRKDCIDTFSFDYQYLLTFVRKTAEVGLERPKLHHFTEIGPAIARHEFLTAGRKKGKIQVKTR